MNNKNIDCEIEIINEIEQVSSMFSVSLSGEKLRHFRNTAPIPIKNSNDEEVATITYHEYVITAWKEGNVKFARFYFGLLIDNLTSSYHNACINLTVKRNGAIFISGSSNGILYPSDDSRSVSGHAIPIQQDQNRVYDNLDNGSYARSLRYDSLTNPNRIPLACRSGDLL